AYQKTRKGNAVVDPADEKQIKLYISLRNNLGDNERVTVGLLLAWLREAKGELEASGSQALRALAVPEANFPLGAELSEDDLAEHRLASMGMAQLDLDNFFILDFFLVNDKSVLGEKVRELSFRNLSNERLKLGGRPAPGAAAAGPPGRDGAASGAGDAGAGPAPAAGNPGARPGLWEGVDAGAVGGGGPPGLLEPAAEPRREVKRHSSDPFVADTENEDEIKSAAEAGRWTARSKLRGGAVDFFMGELVETMKEVKRGQPLAAADGLAAVMTRVCTFAANLFLGHRSCECLPPLCKTFDAFEELGAEVAGLPLLVRELAQIGLESDALPALAGAGAAGRVRFRGPPCYESFLAFRFKRDLDRAKAAAGQGQLQALKEIVAAIADDVAPDVYMHASTALQAFDPKPPLAARVEWALADDFALAVVQEWAPDSDACRAVTLAGPAPPFDDIAYSEFEKGCPLLMNAGVEPHSPLVEEARAFLTALQGVSAWGQQQTSAWFELLERLAFAERLGLAVIAALPREDLVAVVGAAKAFVKPKGKKGKMHEWLKSSVAAADAAEGPPSPRPALAGGPPPAPGGAEGAPAGAVADGLAAGEAEGAPAGAIARGVVAGGAEGAPAGAIAEGPPAGGARAGVWKEIEESEEGQRGILADIYYPKVKSLFPEVWCRTVTASGGMAGLRSTLEMSRKRGRAEDELTATLVRCLDHGMGGKTLESWMNEQENREVFAEWVSVATLLAKGGGGRSATGEGAPAATGGRGAAGGAGLFKKGGVVVGVSMKHKEDWNGRRCEILEVLSSTYKVRRRADWGS
ncbi:unnamed protein product, partial [Prorocentrum cordatum]